MDCWPKGLPERHDALTPERRHEWDGWVLVVARSGRGQALVDSATAAGVMTLKPAESKEIFETQPLAPKSRHVAWIWQKYDEIGPFLTIFSNL